MDEKELLRNKNISHGLISSGYLENIFPNLYIPKYIPKNHEIDILGYS